MHLIVSNKDAIIVPKATQTKKLGPESGIHMFTVLILREYHTMIRIKYENTFGEKSVRMCKLGSE